MGIAIANSKLCFSNVNGIFTHIDSLKNEKIKKSIIDINYFPIKFNMVGTADIHDVRLTSDGSKSYFVLAKYNCIATTSEDKSFNVVWVPPWIEYDKELHKSLPFEDRCHLNGLCLINDKPGFICAASKTNYMNAWKESKNKGQGIVYDIQKDEICCTGLYNPHSPRFYKNKLWILESGTGNFGYIKIANRKFKPCKFIPGFLRGLDFINNYAVVTSSLDRHDQAFKDIPLSKYLDDTNTESKCGIWIINLDTYDIVYNIIFTKNVIELYDIAISPGFISNITHYLDTNATTNKFII
jgi:uncharacterized protein (TIGR03032 family)